MADKKKKSPASDFDDDFPEINDDASADDVSLDDFPDNIEFPSDEPEETGSALDTDVALDDFGDLEDTADQPQETGDDFGEVAADDAADASADDDWGGVEEEETGDENEAGVDDEIDYDPEAEEAEPSLVDKLKKQAPFLGAAIFCAGFVAYVGMGILSGGGSAPQQQQQNTQNYDLAPTPSNGPPTGPSPNGADVAPSPSVPTGPSGQPQQPPPPAAGPEGPPGVQPPQGLPMQPEQGPQNAGPGDFPPMPAGQPDGGEMSLPAMQEPEATDIGGAPRMVDGEVLDQLVTKNDLSSVLAETMEEVVGHRFNEVMTSINTLSVDIDDLTSSVNDISTKVEDLSFEVADIRTDVTSVETRMDTYEDRLESIEFRLENLSINDRVVSQTTPPLVSAAEPPLIPPAPLVETAPSDDGLGFDASAPLMQPQPEPDTAPAPALPTEETTVADAGEVSSEEQAQAESAEETVVAEEDAATVPPPAEREPAAKAEPKKQAKAAPQRRAPAATPSRPAQGGMLSPPEKPLVVQGYYLKGVSRGLAWIDTGRGIIRAGVGQHIDGLGRVQRISQGPDGWMVMTDTGLILP